MDDIASKQGYLSFANFEKESSVGSHCKMCMSQSHLATFLTMSDVALDESMMADKAAESKVASILGRQWHQSKWAILLRFKKKKLTGE